MKIQDIIFVVFLLLLFWRRKPELFIWLGVVCFSISIPLFAFWVFFTAERLVAYGVAFFSLGILSYLLIFKKRSKKR